MGRKGGRTKDPYAKVTKDEREEMERMSEEELNAKIASIAKNDSALQEAKSKDEDLRKIKEQLKFANEPYNDAKKANAQRIAYARFMLDAKGKPAGESGIREDSATA